MNISGIYWNAELFKRKKSAEELKSKKKNSNDLSCFEKILDAEEQKLGNCGQEQDLRQRPDEADY